MKLIVRIILVCYIISFISCGRDLNRFVTLAPPSFRSVKVKNVNFFGGISIDSINKEKNDRTLHLVYDEYNALRYVEIKRRGDLLKQYTVAQTEKGLMLTAIIEPPPFGRYHHADTLLFLNDTCYHKQMDCITVSPGSFRNTGYGRFRMYYFKDKIFYEGNTSSYIESSPHLSGDIFSTISMISNGALQLEDYRDLGIDDEKTRMHFFRERFVGH
jgi:hypothetical protein